MPTESLQVFPTCRFLRIKPEEEEHIKERLDLLRFYINGGDSDDTLEDREAYRQQFLSLCQHNLFFPWCEKLDQLCLIASFVLGRRRGASPIGSSAANTCRMENCEDREPDEIDPMSLEEWLFNHLCLE